MDIKVFSELEIQRFITNTSHIVISIQDPDSDYVKLPEQASRKAWIGLHFHDLDGFSYSPALGLKKYNLFNEAHAKLILDLVEIYKNKVDLVCVNCVAGISRSAGIAAALGKIYNGQDQYFFDKYLPNMWAYRKTLDYYHEQKEKENNSN